ncbi:hypothetical protein BH20ACT22_BH20ACT22_18930 [soil metagenome]
MLFLNAPRPFCVLDPVDCNPASPETLVENVRPAAIFDHTLRFGLPPEVGGRDRSLPEDHRRADQ